MRASFAQYLRLNIPVSASDRTVIREARKMLSDSGRSREQRDARQLWVRTMLNFHDNARGLVRRFKL